MEKIKRTQGKETEKVDLNRTETQKTIKLTQDGNPLHCNADCVEEMKTYQNHGKCEAITKYDSGKATMKSEEIQLTNPGKILEFFKPLDPLQKDLKILISFQ